MQCSQYKVATRYGDSSSVIFHKGLFNNSLADFDLPLQSVAYAHLDGDWFESVYGVLVVIAPFVSIGGIIIFDDVFHFSGAGLAFDKYFGVKSKKFAEKEERKVTITVTGSNTKNALSFVLSRRVKMIARRVVSHAE